MDKPPPPGLDRPSPPTQSADQRKARLASALRANLKRRKAAGPAKPAKG